MKQYRLLILIFALGLFSCSNMLGDFMAPTVSEDWEISIVDNVSEENSGDSVTISWPPADEESHSDGDITYEIYITEDDPTYDTSILTEDKMVFQEVGVTEVILPKTPDGTVGFLTLIAKDQKGNETIIIIIPISLDEDLLNSTDEDGKFNPRPDTQNPVAGGESGETTVTALPLGPETIGLSWEEASDNSNNDLEYMVVISTSENIESISDAQLNGSIVCEWTEDINSFEVNGLLPDTTYWYNVLVRDSAGNISTYQYGVITTPSADGSLNIQITLEGVSELSISFLDSSNQVITGTPIFPKDEIVTITVPESIGVVKKWIVDSSELNSSGNSLNLDLTSIHIDRSLEIHRITVIVENSNQPYSTQLKFRISR